MSLPTEWSRINSWIRFDDIVTVPTSIEETVESKWPEIPELTDYSVELDPSFWKNFPKQALPTRPESSVSIHNLESKIQSLKEKMTIHEYDRSMKAVDYLKNGAPSFQKEVLPGCYVKNALCAIKHGKEVTEAVATWVKEGFAAGPFDGPPCPNFRVNPLIAFVQPGKVRPVLNVSAPEMASFNSNVDEFQTEKVKMASAKQFGHNLLECGLASVMSKHDVVAAYKQLPAKIEDLRLQGFRWLGKYFVETRQVFGAKTSVCNYDILGETLKLLALLESNIPHHLVFRQVDDVPSCSPAGTGWCEDFSTKYRNLCEHVNIKLAPNCPQYDKAFELSSRGKVLGIMFDANNMTWRLPQKKIDKCLRCIQTALYQDSISLKELQKLIGRMNDVSQMCSFMKIYRQPVIECLSGISSDAPEWTRVKISSQAKDDLKVWAGFLMSDHKWLPIGPIYHEPPRVCKEFVSDAAGLPDLTSFHTAPGCGNIGFCEKGEIIFANQLAWPVHFLSSKDEKGVSFSDKTTTLEVIGLLMPFLLVPELLAGQHVNYGGLF